MAGSIPACAMTESFRRHRAAYAAALIAGLIVLAVPAFEAGRLAAAQAGQALGIVVLPPP